MRSSLKVAKWAVLLACVAPITACTFLDSFVPKKGAESDIIDREQGLTLDDYRNLNKQDKTPDLREDANISVALGAPPIPDIAQVLAAPRPPKVANTKLVTLSVTDDVPLRDVLFELGRLASVDVEVGPGLDTTGINLRATDRPFNEVIERIATLANLRYSVSGRSIRIERDLPYIKNYSLDFLNLVRSNSSTYEVQTSILDSGSGGGGGSSGGSSSSGSGGSSGSAVGGGSVGSGSTSSSITSAGESDMWSGLEASLNEIIAYSPSSASADPTAAAAAATTGSSTSAGSIVINRQAGIVSANATEAQHEMIQRFLTLMSRNSSAQVLIEAKIVEVSLSDQFLSGVNWNQIIGSVNQAYGSIGSYTSSITGGPVLGGQADPTASTFALGIESGDLDFVIRATQRFGTTRTLSSPRLSATNNQQAVLTFARNEVFFDCDTTPPQIINTAGGSQTVPGTTTCDARSVPIGIILNILPSISLDKHEVTLNVRPTLTRRVGQVQDPTQPNSFYPVIEVRELDSVMKVSSGGVMIIGGLMEDATRNQVDGVPGLNEVPLVGNLFKSRTEDSLKRELIIFIKATIINPDGSADRVDRKVYEKFITDPRPLFPKQ